MPVGTRIKLRRDTAANWTSSNPVLSLGEAGVETDTLKWKVGDGSTVWASLDYMLGGATGSTVYAGTAILASGSVTVAATWVTPDTVIVVTPQTDDASARQLYVDPTNIVDATSFDISSSDGSDARTVFWMASEPNPAIPAYVMKADSSSNDAYVYKDFGNQADVWVTFDARYSAATLTFWGTPNEYSGTFGATEPNGGGSGGGRFWLEPDFVSGNIGLFRAGATPNTVNDPSSAPTGDAWHTYELRVIASGAASLIIDGGTPITTNSGNATQSGRIYLGLLDSPYNDPASVCYFRNVKVGTTQGASDLFADDFLSGDLSNWDTTSGDCTVILDPF